MVLISVHVFSACTDAVDEAVDGASCKEILVLFGPETLGDNGYNDLIYKGLIDCINGDRLSGIKTSYYNPTSMVEAEKIVDTWKADSSDRRKLLVLANSAYKEMLLRDFSDNSLDTVSRSVLMFESETIDIGGVHTFNVSLYGISYISGAVAGKLFLDPLILMGNSNDTVTSRAVDGFCDGYVDAGGSSDDIGLVYLSDSNAGYDMADSVYAQMYDWVQYHNFIMPMIGGSAMGVFRYVREHPTGLYTVGIDIDQSDLCSHILGSMVKRIDSVFRTYLEDWAAGKELPKSVTYGLQDGYADWVPGHVNLEEYGIDLDEIKVKATEKELEYENR